MPTYEYLCKTCGHRFETWQKMIDDPLTTCPDCGAAIRRVLFPAGVVFKGSGFYKTDHRDSASVASSAKDEPTKATSEGDKAAPAHVSTDNKSSESGSNKPAESGASKSSTPASGDNGSKPATTTSAA